MVKSVEVLAHVDSLFPLKLHLILGERSEEHGNGDSVDDGPPLEGWHNSGSTSISEESLVHVEEVGRGKETCEQCGHDKCSLGVVHSIDDSFVLLPLVIIHI